MAAKVDGKNIVKPAIVLLLVSSVAAMCLGVVSEITAEATAIQEEKSLNEGMTAVMPSSASFSELTDIELSGTVSAVYQAEDGGFVVVTNPNGFNGALGVMVGVGTDGAITGLRVTSHAETPGLGAKATDPAFYEQFTGKSGSILVTKDGGDIDSITSSTITSRAVALGANDAVAWAAMYLGVVSEITAEPSAIQEEKSLNEGMTAVMPSSASFSELTDIELSGTVSAVYQAEDGGFVVVTNPNGFNGALGVMVGVGTDGAITGLRVTSHAETPGLGAKATDPAFYEQFTGKSGSILVTKDGGDIDSITSSTITSRAVALGANDAVAWVSANGGAY